MIIFAFCPLTTSLWAELPELNSVQDKRMRRIPSADDVESCLATRHIYTIATGEDDKVIKVCDRGQRRDQTKPPPLDLLLLSYQCNSVPWSNNNLRHTRTHGLKSVIAVILLKRVYSFMNQQPLSFSSTVNLNVYNWKIVEKLGHFT